MSDDISDALAELEDATFKWNGETYPCQGGAIRRGGILEQGGFEVDAGVQLVIRASLFPTKKPTRGHKVEHNGRRFQIDSDTTAGELIVLDCSDENRG